MSSSVISAKGDSKADLPEAFSRSVFSRICWKTLPRSSELRFTRSRNETERGALVEDDHEDDLPAHDGDVDVVFLPLVEEDGELALADEFGEAVGGSHIAGGERGEGGSVQPFHIPVAAICWPFLSTRKTTLALASTRSLEMISLIFLELFLIHNEVGRTHELLLPRLERLPQKVQVAHASGRSSSGKVRKKAKIPATLPRGDIVVRCRPFRGGSSRREHAPVFLFILREGVPRVSRTILRNNFPRSPCYMGDSL